MISFGFTAFLFGGLLVAIPIVLHLLKQKPRTPQAFPALIFLYATAAKKQNRNRLRKFIILLLRSLIFCLLAAAFAWPYITDMQEEPDEARVILWDNSFSMQEFQIFTNLCDQAHKLINKTDSAHPTLIGAVNESIKWSGDFTTDPTSLTKWFKRNNKSYGTSYFRQALRIAESKLKTAIAKKKTIVLVTDKQFIPWENVKLNQPLSPGVDLKIILPERKKPISNTAITMVKTSDAYISPNQKITFKITCRNYSTKEKEAKLVIYLGGKLINKKEIKLPPNNFQFEYFSITTPAGTLKPLSGSVEMRTPGDDLIVDNIHYFNLNPIKKSEFYLTPLLGSKNFDFIRAALKSDSGKIQVSEFTNGSSLTPDVFSGLVILQDLRAFDNNIYSKLDKILEAGGNLAIIWHNDQNTINVLRHFGIKVLDKESKGVKRFEMLNFQHPLFKDYLEVRAGAWFDILFFKVPTLKFSVDTQILATFDKNIPAITECRVKNGKLFVVATGLDRAHSNWPTFGSFLPFWRELLLYSSRTTKNSYYLRVRNGKKQWKDKVKVTPLTSKPEESEFLALNIPGNYLVKRQKQERIYSINVPLRESDNTLIPANYKFNKLVSQEKPAVRKVIKDLKKNKLQKMQKAKSYWWLFLVLVLILSFMELLLANRTAL